MSPGAVVRGRFADDDRAFLTRALAADANGRTRDQPSALSHDVHVGGAGSAEHEFAQRLIPRLKVRRRHHRLERLKLEDEALTAGCAGESSDIVPADLDRHGDTVSLSAAAH